VAKREEASGEGGLDAPARLPFSKELQDGFDAAEARVIHPELVETRGARGTGPGLALAARRTAWPAMARVGDDEGAALDGGGRRSLKDNARGEASRTAAAPGASRAVSAASPAVIVQAGAARAAGLAILPRATSASRAAPAGNHGAARERERALDGEERDAGSATRAAASPGPAASACAAAAAHGRLGIRVEAGASAAALAGAASGSRAAPGGRPAGRARGRRERSEGRGGAARGPRLSVGTGIAREDRSVGDGIGRRQLTGRAGSPSSCGSPASVTGGGSGTADPAVG